MAAKEHRSIPTVPHQFYVKLLLAAALGILGGPMTVQKAELDTSRSARQGRPSEVRQDRRRSLTTGTVLAVRSASIFHRPITPSFY